MITVTLSIFVQINKREHNMCEFKIRDEIQYKQQFEEFWKRFMKIVTVSDEIKGAALCVWSEINWSPSNNHSCNMQVHKDTHKIHEVQKEKSDNQLFKNHTSRKLTGYNHFVKCKMNEINKRNIPSGYRMIEIGRMWRELSQIEKDMWNKNAVMSESESNDNLKSTIHRRFISGSEVDEIYGTMNYRPQFDSICSSVSKTIDISDDVRKIMIVSWSHMDWLIKNTENISQIFGQILPDNVEKMLSKII